MKRLVIAGVASGVGKTTVSVALTAALRARGYKVATFKCGPDYLDPTWLERASGRASHNLDGWMMGHEAVLGTFARASAGCDVAVIEGMMGLYDGASASSDEGSAAEIARWLSAPVVAVADCWAIARTLAAVGVGLRAFDPRLNLAGLFANRVGGRAHLQLLIDACRDSVPVVGGLPRQDQLIFSERHLGLHHAAQSQVDPSAWGALLEEWGAVDSLLAVARSAPPLELAASPSLPGATKCRIAVARDAAFHFYYDDNLARLQSLGAELRFFSPLGDASLPPADAVYLGGGYPELHANALAANRSMRASLAAFGGPIYAECGGLMYLCRALRTLDGVTHEMVGLVDATAVMTPSLQALGYVEVETTAPTLLGAAGVRFRGHQFRHCTLDKDPPSGAYRVRRFSDGAEHVEAWGGGRVLGSWVHAHWASSPAAAEGFVRAATKQATTERT